MNSMSRRFSELEGVRGLAAAIVVIFHIVLIFYPRIVYGDFSNISVSHSRVEDILYGSPLNLLSWGVFSVAIFFVLSGFVLSTGFFNGDDNIIKKLGSRRYLRLMLPALASVLIAYLLIKFGLSTFRPVAAEIIGGGSLGIQWNFIPSLGEALAQGVWSIFATGQDTYNRVLWTMHYEFFGSLLIFLLLLIFGRAKNRMIVFLIIFFISLGSWYMGFIAGVMLADIHARVIKSGKFKLDTLTTNMLGIILLFAGLIIGSFPLEGASSTIYRILEIPYLSGPQNVAVYLSIGAFMVMTAVLLSGWLKWLLRLPIISGLGKYTFSLYLTHMLVLLTLTPFLFVLFIDNVGYNWAVIWSVAISLPVVAIVAYVFERVIDAPSVRLSSWASGVVEGSISPDLRRVKCLIRLLTEIPEKKPRP